MSNPVLIGVGVGAFAGLAVFGDLVVGAIFGGAMGLGYTIIKGR
jgi:hypothetical protein